MTSAFPEKQAIIIHKLFLTVDQEKMSLVGEFIKIQYQLRKGKNRLIYIPSTAADCRVDLWSTWLLSHTALLYRTSNGYMIQQASYPFTQKCSQRTLERSHESQKMHALVIREDYQA